MSDPGSFQERLSRSSSWGGARLSQDRADEYCRPTAVDRADSFADAVWRAVSLGHDADTVGAVAGALAGAVFGETGIEPLPREGLTTKHPLFEGVDVDELRSLADRLTALADASGRTGG